jgi:hypothetical protein
MSRRVVMATILAIPLAGCSYSDIGVGKSETMTAEQAVAYEQDQTGRVLPAPLEDHVGNGPAVQPDRMVTTDLTFSQVDGRPFGSGRVRFLHSAPSSPGPYRLGYASPAVLAAMAGMREGGSRRIQITDSDCLDISSAGQQGSVPQTCRVVGTRYEAITSGSVSYPSRTPLLANISIVRVCRPKVVQGEIPSVMGGGPARTLRELWCR